MTQRTNKAKTLIPLIAAIVKICLWVISTSDHRQCMCRCNLKHIEIVMYFSRLTDAVVNQRLLILSFLLMSQRNTACAIWLVLPQEKGARESIIPQRLGNTSMGVFINNGEAVPLLSCCLKCIWNSCLCSYSGCCTLMFLYFCLCIRKLA